MTKYINNKYNSLILRQEMAVGIEKEYDKLSKKYNLPRFKQLDEEFEVSDLENANFLLKNILRKMAERLEFYSNLINDLLQPDTSSLSSMHEIRFFMDDEKNSMFALFKRLMKTNRSALELILENNERKQVEFLNKFFDDWKKIKAELIKYLRKMRESWDKETSIEEDLGYFG